MEGRENSWAALLPAAAVSGGLRAIGLYAASDALVLTEVPLAVFLTFTLAASAAVSAVLQGRSPQATKGRRDDHSRRVTLHAVVLASAMWLFCYGLKHCGPIRAILVEASQVALITAIALPLRGAARKRGRGSWRGGLALVLVALVLLLGTHGAHPHRARRLSEEGGPAAVALPSEEAAGGKFGQVLLRTEPPGASKISAHWPRPLATDEDEVEDDDDDDDDEDEPLNASPWHP